MEQVCSSFDQTPGADNRPAPFFADGVLVGELRNQGWSVGRSSALERGHRAGPNHVHR